MKLLLGLLLVLLAFNPGAKELPVVDYFPARPGVIHHFAGEGNEYAPFIRTFQYVEEPYIQLTDATGGTTLVQVYERRPDKLLLWYREGEFYGEERIIGTAWEEPLIIIEGPLEIGHSWITQDQTRTITAVDASLELPGGKFDHVLVIEITYAHQDAGIGHEYYAPGVGLIQRTYTGEDWQVSSYLEKIDRGGDSRGL
ncbi:MAG: hypothetical protein ACOYD6_08505 [Limnochordia bacterium]|jgi:hypothetical protein